MKISNEISKQIYEQATNPTNKLTNQEIGNKFGIDEATVRYHIKKWEGKLHEISRSDVRVADALADHTCDCIQESQDILNAVKDSIQEAKGKGVSPEKLAPLYSNWLKSLELAGELLGEIGRGSGTNVNVNVQNVQKAVYLQEYQELKQVVVGELCDNCKEKVRVRLHELIKET